MTLQPRRYEDARSRLLAFDHGAHLASWDLDGSPVVWLSESAYLDGSHALRGGIPICFPWFADGPDGRHSPSHGLVRLAHWRPVPGTHEEIWAWEIDDTSLAGAPGAELVPGPFLARYAVSLTRGSGTSPSPSLQVELAVTNTGEVAYQVEVALHTYLAIHDIREVEVHGLDGAPYFDKVRRHRETEADPVVAQGEIDRVYDRSGPVEVHDRGGARIVQVLPHGATQTVVWNPWQTRALDLPDVPDDGWHRFVCVETAATADHALTIEPGATRTIGCSISVLPVPAP